MSRGLVCVVVFLVSALLTDRVASIELYETCVDDAACTDVAPVTANSRCQRAFAGCPNGTCTCASGFVDVANSKNCTTEKGNGETCTSTDECAKNPEGRSSLVCVGTLSKKCECDKGTYSPEHKICILLGELDCTDDSDCNGMTGNGVTTAVCGSSGKCVCGEGYITDEERQTCSEPYVGQPCTPTVGCIDSGITELDPTCSEGTCVCGAGQTAVTVSGFKFCVATDSDRREAGVACDNYSQCQSHLCTISCAGFREKLCVSVSKASTQTHVSGFIVASLLLIASYSM